MLMLSMTEYLYLFKQCLEIPDFSTFSLPLTAAE